MLVIYMEDIILRKKIQFFSLGFLFMKFIIYRQCRNSIDKRWYTFNDSDVSEININKEGYETTGSAQPYILFYAKKSLLKSNNPNL